MAAPVLQTQTGPETQGATTAWTPAKPGALVDGEHMFLHIGGRSATVTYTVPTGWTEVPLTVNTGTDDHNRLWWKYIDGVTYTAATEPATYSISATESVSVNLSIWRVSGANTSVPYDSHNSASNVGGGTAGQVPSFTVGVNDCLLIYFGVQNSSNANAWGAITGYTERYDTGFGAGGNTHNTNMQSKDTAQAAGATGTITSTPLNASWASAVIAIAPPAADTTPPAAPTGLTATAFLQ